MTPAAVTRMQVTENLPVRAYCESATSLVEALSPVPEAQLWFPAGRGEHDTNADRSRSQSTNSSCRPPAVNLQIPSRAACVQTTDSENQGHIRRGARQLRRGRRRRFQVRDHAVGDGTPASPGKMTLWT